MAAPIVFVVSGDTTAVVAVAVAIAAAATCVPRRSVTSSAGVDHLDAVLDEREDGPRPPPA
ncbi:MAG: hypothetical protein PGN33_22320 [Methylobacterium radiotolerans]